MTQFKENQEQMIHKVIEIYWSGQVYKATRKAIIYKQRNVGMVVNRNGQPTKIAQRLNQCRGGHKRTENNL